MEDKHVCLFRCDGLREKLLNRIFREEVGCSLESKYTPYTFGDKQIIAMTVTIYVMPVPLKNIFQNNLLYAQC